MQLSAWARFKRKASYSRAPIQNIIASVLSGQYAYSNGLESITQATNAFNAGLAGLAPQNGDNPNAPSAYLNYILFNSSYARVAAGAVQVPQAAGFEEPQRGSGYTNNNLLKFGNDIPVSQTGYLYIWVSNESENTEVWFDDLNVIHQKTLVAEATDYGVWGDVMREQKWEDLEGKYRYGYQGQYSERDEETGFNHYELREYDPIRGQWNTIDPEGQFWSPYVAMGNDPINSTDPDGGFTGYERQDNGSLKKVNNVGGDEFDVIYNHDGTIEQTFLSAITVSANMSRSAISAAKLGIYQGQHDFMNHGATQTVLDLLPMVNVVNRLVHAAQDIEDGNYGTAALSFGVGRLGKVAKASKSLGIHGNDLANPAKTWGYKLYDRVTKEFLKNGITSKLDPLKRYTRKFMADKIMIPIKRFHNRAKAYNWEYGENLKQRGSLNKNMH